MKAQQKNCQGEEDKVNAHGIGRQNEAHSKGRQPACPKQDSPRSQVNNIGHSFHKLKDVDMRHKLVAN